MQTPHQAPTLIINLSNTAYHGHHIEQSPIRNCKCQEHDPADTQLITITESGFPKFQHEFPQALQVYHQFQEHLYTVDGVIL